MRVSPVYRPEHSHKCPFCFAAWIHEGYENMCTLSRIRGCTVCMQPAAVRARAIKTQEKREAERYSGRENSYFPWVVFAEHWADVHNSKAFENYVEHEHELERPICPGRIEEP